MLNFRPVTRALSALPLILAAGCFPEGATNAVDHAANIAAKSVPAESSLIGSAAAPLPSVVVTNNGGKGVGGVPVTFTVTAGNGTVTSTSVKTDKQGIAAVGWTYGMVEGDNILNATLGSLDPVQFKVHTTGGGPKSMTKQNDGQSAAVGEALAVPVSVIVLNGGGHPVTGASVKFTALGGSTLAGGATTATVSSDADGRATTPWIMGTVPGAYAMTAEVSGVPTQTLGATAVAGPAYAVEKSGDAQVGTVDTYLPSSIGLTVRDRFQNPVAGVALTYSPQNGGSVPAGTALLTDASGQASTQWKLPTVAGNATLSFTAGSLSGSFTATANAGAPAKLEKMASSDNQTGNAGQALPQAMSVTVRDAYDNALSNVSVTFTPAGGSVNPPTVATDLSGQANTIWTLGSTGGATTLNASAVGIANPVVFSATVIAPTADPCDSHGTLVVGRSVSGNLANSQCAFPMTRTKVDLWTLNLASAPGFEVIETMDDLNSPDAFMAMYRGQYASAQLIASNDDIDGNNGNYNSHVRFLGGAGQALVGASYAMWFANDPGSTYHLVANRWSGAVTACQEVYATNGTNTSQILDNDDCIADAKRAHSDRVLVMLRPGETMTVTMNATAFDAKLDLESSRFAVVASDDNGGGGTNARLTYTAPASSSSVDRFAIFATSVGTAGGNYTLTIDISTPPGLAPMMRSATQSAPTGTVFGPGVEMPKAMRRQ